MNVASFHYYLLDGIDGWFLSMGFEEDTMYSSGYSEHEEEINTGMNESIDISDLKETIRQVLLEEGIIGVTRIAEKWEGGEIILKPGKPGLQEKSISIETFFHKIVMVRDRLRVLEQNINSSDNLSGTEKLNLQQYITRCYGSLTTFNVFFAEKSDCFIGETSK